ncbi:MAG: hypothetical protein HWD60_19225 [Defluviicoccus sp.]|nr:MAG: hypothetical protein HWD60_19225 [Defluviicoccus sp.]
MTKPRYAMRYAIAGLLTLTALSACETYVDPNTGQTQVRWTLPGTQANADASRERWWQCVQFRSELVRAQPAQRPAAGNWSVQ